VEQEGHVRVISFIYLSNRPGGIDVLTHTLKHQDSDDWELVFVDGFPGRVQRGHARKHLDLNNGRVGWHGPPKPKTFPWSRTGFVNAMNTGLIHARGSHVVFLHDFTHAAPASAGAWADVFARCPRELIHGAADVYRTPPPDGVHDVMTWEHQPPLQFRERWVPKHFEVGYWGGPLEFFLSCNGIDERADMCALWALNDVIAKAGFHGYGLRVVPQLLCAQFDHREWQDRIGNSPYRTIGECSDVAEEPVWTGWACNPYNLRDERRKAGIIDA